MNKTISTKEYYKEEDKCPECGEYLRTTIEEREGGHTETVSYCKKCGYTGTC